MALLHSRSRPRPAVHLPHRAGFSSSMPEVQPNDHHRATLAAYGVLDCGYTLRTIAVEAEDRTLAGDTLQGAGCVPVKQPMSSDAGRTRICVLPKALSLRPHPILYAHLCRKLCAQNTAPSW